MLTVKFNEYLVGGETLNALAWIINALIVILFYSDESKKLL